MSTRVSSSISPWLKNVTPPVGWDWDLVSSSASSSVASSTTPSSFVTFEKRIWLPLVAAVDFDDFDVAARGRGSIENDSTVINPIEAIRIIINNLIVVMLVGCFDIMMDGDVSMRCG